MGTGNILLEGVNTFAGVFTRLREITQELIPYFIFIALGVLGLELMWNAVKYIMGYLSKKSKGTFGNRGKYYFDGEPEDNRYAQRQIEKEREDYYKKHGHY